MAPIGWVRGWEKWNYLIGLEGVTLLDGVCQWESCDISHRSQTLAQRSNLTLFVS